MSEERERLASLLLGTLLVVVVLALGAILGAHGDVGEPWGWPP